MIFVHLATQMKILLIFSHHFCPSIENPQIVFFYFWHFWEKVQDQVRSASWDSNSGHPKRNSTICLWRVGRGREPWERSEAGGVNDDERHLHHSPVSSPTEELRKDKRRSDNSARRERTVSNFVRDRPFIKDRHSSFYPSGAPPWDSRPVSGAGVAHHH